MKVMTVNNARMTGFRKVSSTFGVAYEKIEEKTDICDLYSENNHLDASRIVDDCVNIIMGIKEASGIS